MKKQLTLSVLLASSLFSAGYQIPNNSINSAALSTANVANAHGADASYYNPANMVRSDYNGHEIESSLTFISLGKINYAPSDGGANIQSKHHDALIPTFHYVSKKLNDKGVRVGFSIISPAGLAREWKDAPASYTAKKFALKTIEFNPTMAIPVNDKLSLGFGFRYVRATGKIALDAIPTSIDNGKDSASFGFNLAASYQATDALNISTTYRSQVTLNLKGDANLPITSVNLEAPIPANFILATAYKVTPTTTVEITYDRTMWSSVKETNFNNPNFGQPTPKKWHDTEAYRLGVTQNLDAITLMGGLAYSTNAADDAYVSFSSPESDSMTYSLGARYKLDESIELGFAALYADYASRTVAQASPIGVNGTLSDKDALSLTMGLNYRF